MSKFKGFVGEENPLLLLLTIAAAELLEPDVVEEEDFLPLAEGDVGVRLQEALTPLLLEWILVLVMLLLLDIRSDTTVL